MSSLVSSKSERTRGEYHAPIRTSSPPSSSSCPICLMDFDGEPFRGGNGIDSETDSHPLQQQQQQQQQPQQKDVCRPVALGCQHTFCFPCLLMHAEHSVETKRVPLHCPEVGCRTVIPDDVLVTILDSCDPKIVQQVERLQSLVDDPDQMPCTRCSALVSTIKTKKNYTNFDDGVNNIITTTHHEEEDDDDEEEEYDCPDLTCHVCQHTFCRLHGDVHGDMTCAAFQRTTRGRQLRQSELAIQRFAKPCSRCGALLQKSAGCDYVLCGHCRGDMCYRCGTHAHLQGDTFRRCTKCRSTYHHEVRMPCFAGTLCLFLLTVFTTALIVAWPVLAGAGILLTGCCGGFFHCGRRLNTRRRRLRRRRRNDDSNDDENENYNDDDNRDFEPARGVLAVVVIMFLPLVMLLDGAYMVLSGNEDGFIDGILPEFSGKAEEIPTMELQPTTTTTTTTPATVGTTTTGDAVDLEQGQGG